MAEGVEDGETLEEQRRLQCDEVQGYLVGPPMTADAFASWRQQGGHVARAPLRSADSLTAA